MLKSLLIFSIAAAMAPFGLYAQTNLNPKVDSADRAFLRNAAEINMSEVVLGQFAQQKTSAEPVRAFAQRMITDHSNAQQKLRDLAAREDVVLPDLWNTKDVALYSRLAKLSGTEFDHAYIDAMVQGHTQAVQLFKMESKAAASPALRTFASQTLPMLEAHLKLAHQTAVQIGATSRK
jgi:putative membrane protein